MDFLAAIAKGLPSVKNEANFNGCMQAMDVADSDVCATLLAVFVLRSKLQQLHELWSLVEEKALKWVKAKTKMDVDACLAKCRAL